MLNKATLLGNVGKDPDVRSMQNGNKVANFTLATSERWKDKATGEKREATEWHNIAVFGPLTGVVEQFVRKGSKVLVEGQIKTRKWKDQGGNDRYTTEVVLNGLDAKLILLDGKPEGGARSSAPSNSDAGGHEHDNDFT